MVVGIVGGGPDGLGNRWWVDKIGVSTVEYWYVSPLVEISNMELSPSGGLSQGDRSGDAGDESAVAEWPAVDGSGPADCFFITVDSGSIADCVCCCAVDSR